MDIPTRERTAEVINLADYRRWRAARAQAAPPAARRFLWGWPGTSQLTVVEFPARPAGALPACLPSA